MGNLVRWWLIPDACPLKIPNSLFLPWYWALKPLNLWFPSEVKCSRSQFLLLMMGEGRLGPVNLQKHRDGCLKYEEMYVLRCKCRVPSGLAVKVLDFRVPPGLTHKRNLLGLHGGADVSSVASWHFPCHVCSHWKILNMITQTLRISNWSLTSCSFSTYTVVWIAQVHFWEQLCLANITECYINFC